jgi:hypothetical protein
MAATQFVLVYDSAHRALIEQEAFSDPAAAAEAYFRAEERFRGVKETQVVMLSGESLESVQATHGTFFAEPFAFVRALNGRTAAEADAE